MPYKAAILSAIDELKDHQTGSTQTSIRRHIQEHDTTFASAIAKQSSDHEWNETLFLSTLKSLVHTGILVHINGTNYKYSDEYLNKRTECIKNRSESIEEQHQQQHHEQHVREEPPKEIPKKKTIHAKVKINEGKVITVVNPDVIKHGDDMETDEDEQAVDGLGNEMSCNGGSGSNKKHSVKIIPRKVGVKKM